MTTVLLEPFESFAHWAPEGSVTSWSIVAGRTGNCAQAIGGQWYFWRSDPTLASGTITLGFALQVSALSANREIILLGSDTTGSSTQPGTSHLTFMLNTDGSIGVRRGGTSGTVLGTTATGVIVASTSVWQYIEIQAVLSDTVGAVTINVAGTQVLALTSQDTKNGGTKTVFDAIEISGASSVTTKFDDMYVAMGGGETFRGSQTITAPPTTALSARQQVRVLITPQPVARDARQQVRVLMGLGGVGNITFGGNAIISYTATGTGAINFGGSGVVSIVGTGGIVFNGTGSVQPPTPFGDVNVAVTVAGDPTADRLLVGAGFEVRVYDVLHPNNLLAVIPRPETVLFEDTLSDVGSGQITVATSDVPASVFGKDHIWRVFWEGLERFAFFAEQIQDDQVQDDEVRRWTIAGRGAGQWLDKMQTYPSSLSSTSNVRSFTSVSMASVLQTLLTEAHGRGTGTFITQDGWNSGSDSEGVSWTDTQTLGLGVGTSLLTLTQQFGQSVTFDWHMTSRFRLTLAKQLGQDKSSYIRIQPVGSIETEQVVADMTALWDVVLVQDSAGHYTETVDSTAVTTWGRRELAASNTDGRAGFGQQLVNSYNHQAVQRTVQMSASTPGRKPFVDFGLGDFISCEFVDGTVLKCRVIAIAMSSGYSEGEECEVTLDFGLGTRVPFQSIGPDSGLGDGGFGGGGITMITSDDGSIDVTNPTGPVVDLSGLGGIYASLRGDGETMSPGDLTQTGGFTVTDAAGDGVWLNTEGDIKLQQETAPDSTDTDTQVLITSRNFTPGGTASIVLRAYDVDKGGIVIESGNYLFPINPTPGQTDVAASNDIVLTYGAGTTVGPPTVPTGPPYGMSEGLVIQSARIDYAYGPVHIYVTGGDPNGGPTSFFGVYSRAAGDLCISTGPAAGGPGLYQSTGVGNGNWVPIY